MYTKSATLILSLLLLGAMACKPNHAVTENGGGPCGFLSASEVADVQGETISDTHGSERPNGLLVTSQCFYRLPTFSKSVSLEVMRPTSTGESAHAAEEFWTRRFSKHRQKEDRATEEMLAESKKERGERKSGVEDGEEEEGAPPEPIAGLGDEAYWTGSQINGTLYVRKKDIIVRLSIGGAEDQPSKIKKARALAEQVLKRL